MIQVPVIDKGPRILLDSDVIRHLIKGESLSILHCLYGNRLLFLDVVRDELFKSTHIHVVLENFISFNKIEVKEFPVSNPGILKEFAWLKKDTELVKAHVWLSPDLKKI